MSAPDAFLFAAATIGGTICVIAIACGFGIFVAEHPIIGTIVALLVLGAAVMAFAMLAPT